MKKELRFSFLVTLVEKEGLERLAEMNGESQASYLRRLIRQSAEQQGLSKPIKDTPELELPDVPESDPAKIQDKSIYYEEVPNGK